MTTPLQWFDRSSLRSKFYLLGVFCLLAIALPTELYWQEAQKSIEFSETEIKGLTPTKAVFKLIQRSQQFRGLSTLYLKVHETPESRDLLPANISLKEQEVESALAELKLVIEKTESHRLLESFESIERDWQELKFQGKKNHPDWHDYFVAQVKFLRKQLDFLQAIVDSHKLSLDPDADGYFLISANLMQLPELTETLGQMRALGAVYLSSAEPTDEQRYAIQALLALSTERMKDINVTVEKAFRENAQQHKIIFDKYANTQEQFQKITQLVNAEILEHQSGQPHIQDATSYFSAFTLSINSFFSYADDANQTIRQILTDRVAVKNRSISALLFYCFIFFLFATLLVIRFIHTLRQQLGGEPSYASSIVKRITQGNLEEPILASNAESLLADMQQMQLKLQETDRLKTEFVSTVSHELRTPLTAISGAIAISLSGKLGELPPQTREILAIAHKNSLRLTELINDLLDIDQLIAGQLVFESTPVDLVASIQETKQALNNFADKLGVTIESVTDLKHALVMADERRLLQVLSNLVSNAIKFSPAGEKIYVNLSTQNSRARIEVVDQGSGIPDEFRTRIFQKFSQGDSSDRRAKGGTGLGLAIAKALVTQMGGTIGFHSSPGVGSCFFIEFELLQNSSSEAHNTAVDSTESREENP